MSPEFLAELREWVALLGLGKREVFCVFVVVLVFIRLPLILKHLNERYVIRKDFKARGRKLKAKIEQEKARRLGRAKKRDK